MCDTGTRIAMTTECTQSRPFTALLGDEPREPGTAFDFLMGDYEVAERARTFLDDAWRRCAPYLVLFSRDEIWNCDEVHGRAPGQDFVLIHNVHAAVPLPRGWLGRGREFSPIDGVLQPDDYKPSRQEVGFDVGG